MTLTFDFGDAAAGGDWVTIPAGRYVFRLVKAEAGQSKAGKPKAIVQFEVLVSSDPIWVGGIIVQHWPTKGPASFRFRDFLKAIGHKAGERGKVQLAKYYGAELGAVATVTEGDDGNEFNDLRGLVPGAQMRDILGDSYGSNEEDEEENEEIDDGPPFEEDDDSDENKEADDTEEFTIDDINKMALAELREIAEEFEVSTEPAEGKNRLSAPQLRKRLISELFTEDDEGDEDDEDAEPF